MFHSLAFRTRPAQAGCFHRPGKSTAKVGRYHGTPFRFQSRPIFLFTLESDASASSMETNGHKSHFQNLLEIAGSVRVRLQSCREFSKEMVALAPASICFQLFAVQQRLKPESGWAIFGTTEVVP
jgi:hypothetical protein